MSKKLKIVKESFGRWVVMNGKDVEAVYDTLLSAQNHVRLEKE